jgi:hypothetical protein
MGGDEGRLCLERHDLGSLTEIRFCHDRPAGRALASSAFATGRRSRHDDQTHGPLRP